MTSTSKKNPQNAIEWKGVNLAGSEFGDENLPGIYGSHYTYPAVASIDYFKSKGMNIVRLPFRWERLQPHLNQEFEPTEFSRLTQFVDGATTKGVYVVLDLHNYGRYHDHVIGSDNVSHSAFAFFWEKLAERFKNNEFVVFGLMNEPNGMQTEEWLNAANAAIMAIRNCGAKNTVLVPGNGWTGAHSWNQDWYGTPNAEVMINIVDPARNIVFEVHQYFDADFSGKSPACSRTNEALNGLNTFTDWLRLNQHKGFLAEFGCGPGNDCVTAISGVLKHLEANADVWVGWTWWTGGPWWSSDNDAGAFSIEPNSNADKPQMCFLSQFLP